MSLERITLSPEVQEVLREVAQRHGSALLRVERKDLLRTVTRNEALVHATSSGLSVAERHLVQVHREEVAHALRAAAYHRLVLGPEPPAFVVDGSIASIRQQVPRAADVRMLASEAVRSLPLAAVHPEESSLLDLCASPDSDLWPTAGRLAAAAHRLVPTDATRIYASLDLRREGRLHSAMLSLQTVLTSRGSTHHRVVAWTNLGDILFRLGRPRDAWLAANHACAEDHGWILAQANRSIAALVLGDASLIDRSVREFDRILSSRPDLANELKAMYAERGALLVSAEKVALRRAIRSMRSAAFHAATEVLYVLAVD